MPKVMPAVKNAGRLGNVCLSGLPLLHIVS
jgi:hypothetical protein